MPKARRTTVTLETIVFRELFFGGCCPTDLFSSERHPSMVDVVEDDFEVSARESRHQEGGTVTITRAS